jgi:hypothetical protein
MGHFTGSTSPDSRNFISPATQLLQNSSQVILKETVISLPQ